MVNKTPMTRRGYQRLKEELSRMKSVERVRISKEIGIARAHGDLSENAEYDAAKEAQGILEAKIRNMESKLSTAQVIDIGKLSGSKVVFGATVGLIDLDTDEKLRITIVGDDESDVANKFLSVNSPLVRSLIGKEEGDVAEAVLPGGEKEYEIVSVEFIEIDSL